MSKPGDSFSSAEGSDPSTVGDPIALVVDVDRTLARTDLLWEGLLDLAFRRQHRLPGALGALLEGRAAFKTYVARHSSVDLQNIPLHPSVRGLIEEAKERGSHVLLASAAHVEQVEALRRRVGAHAVVGTEEGVNLKGEAKLAAVLQRFDRFDYVGDSRADLPLLGEARTAYLVEPGPVTESRARSRREDVEVIRDSSLADRLRPVARQIRPHQWAKNALLFVPALAAHLAPTLPLLGTLALGFLAFSFLASSLYVVNDLADLPHDRLHATKRERPLAAGRVSIPAGAATAAVLFAAAALLAWRLPPLFRWAMGGYLVTSAGYSFALKRIPVVDVVVLALLYTIRVLAGAALVGVALSQWFLAFSVFVFLSLALLKRVVELGNLIAEANSEAPGASAADTSGRGYSEEDHVVLLAAGTAAALISSLVYCLYITGSDVRVLYDRPELLWLGLPLLLYWKIRIWLFAARRKVDEDPVVFALRDPESFLTAAGMLLIVFLAS